MSGIDCSSASSPDISNCIVANNAYDAIGCSSSSPIIRNCTIVNNYAGVTCYSGSPTVTNCILWGNDDPDLSGCSATYSCIEDGDGGEGNISDDPCFVDAANGDYSLTSVSPCIDAADGDAAPATNINGQGRYDDPYTANTGTGDPNYVDMGAFEYQGV